MLTNEQKVKILCKHSKVACQVVVYADWVREHYRGKFGTGKFPHTYDEVSPNRFVSSVLFLFWFTEEETYLATMVSISGRREAAKDGSLWMKVPRITTQRPNSSSLYSSFIVPHSPHLNKFKYRLIMYASHCIQYWIFPKVFNTDAVAKLTSSIN